jgi:hypothetical protein
VQGELLAKYPSSDLRVYTVWFSMLAFDSRDGWDRCIMPDERVIHFWDEERVVSQRFSEQIYGETGSMWDTYLLYGPEAKWEDPASVPAPLISSDATVIRARDRLQSDILPLLQARRP